MFFNRKPITVGMPAPKEYEGDKSDFPKFIPTKPSTVERLNDALLDLAGLLLWNVILAMASFSAFIKYDVR